MEPLRVSRFPFSWAANKRTATKTWSVGQTAVPVFVGMSSVPLIQGFLTREPRDSRLIWQMTQWQNGRRNIAINQWAKLWRPHVLFAFLLRLTKISGFVLGLRHLSAPVGVCFDQIWRTCEWGGRVGIFAHIYIYIYIFIVSHVTLHKYFINCFAFILTVAPKFWLPFVNPFTCRCCCTFFFCFLARLLLFLLSCEAIIASCHTYCPWGRHLTAHWP